MAFMKYSIKVRTEISIKLQNKSNVRTIHFHFLIDYSLNPDLPPATTAGIGSENGRCCVDNAGLEDV